ncbi:hypothetical protein [uncultured Nostoc sp.]|uniref:hypothetical protein n=1 Tax=uncultured Nostoc sp. TaxID=340711 RepID=UPI0035CADD3A
MLDLDAFKNTRLDESILAKTEVETKLILVSKCVEKGMSIQEIAELLEIPGFLTTILKAL